LGFYPESIMKFHWWAKTDVGKVRDENQDSWSVVPKYNLYMVADGMGGHAGGKIASTMATNYVEKFFVEDNPNKKQAFFNALIQANHQIFEKSSDTPELNGMGTTFTGFIKDKNRLHLLHVGDSKAYLYRDGSIEQLTKDHTWVEEQLRAGYITPEEAQNSKFKSVITRSVGFSKSIEIDSHSIPYSSGDLFILCSDGLSNYIPMPELERICTYSFYSELPELLVQSALNRGGADNITVVVVYIANEPVS
jgi:serine/threonine protein phosphatase PrpC